MFYYLYEIKNLINNKVYVGVHKTKSMDDGYMGSGKVILSAIKKHGAENFTKTILETFANSEAMFAREKEVVTDEFLARPDTYNLRRGGFGGFDYINATGSAVLTFLNEEIAKRGRDTQKKNNSGYFNPAVRERARQKSFDLKLGFMDPEVRRRGHIAAATPEANEKRKQTLAAMNHQQGERNSQFGSMWITNGTTSKKINKLSAIPDGWEKGRKHRV